MFILNVSIEFLPKQMISQKTLSFKQLYFSQVVLHCYPVTSSSFLSTADQEIKFLKSTIKAARGERRSQYNKAKTTKFKTPNDDNSPETNHEATPVVASTTVS